MSLQQQLIDEVMATSGSSVVTVHDKSITPRVQFSYGPLDGIRAAISRAGLRATGESPSPWNSRDLMIHIDGFQVPVLVVEDVCAEKAAA